MAFNRPADYDNVQAYGEFSPLELGGHILTVKHVVSKLSKAGKNMLEIWLDTAPSDSQPNYFLEQYNSDTRENKKWGCIVYQLTEDAEGFTNRGLKTFITCVEKSNPGFKVQWGENFEKCFKDKLIGGIFRREEYLNQQGESKWSTKCFAFRSVDTIKAGVPVPEDKPLNGGGAKPTTPQSSYGNPGFPQYSAYANMPTAPKFEELSDESDLPF